MLSGEHNLLIESLEHLLSQVLSYELYIYYLILYKNSCHPQFIVGKTDAREAFNNCPRLLSQGWKNQVLNQA